MLARGCGFNLKTPARLVTLHQACNPIHSAAPATRCVDLPALTSCLPLRASSACNPLWALARVLTRILIAAPATVATKPHFGRPRPFASLTHSQPLCSTTVSVKWPPMKHFSDGDSKLPGIMGSGSTI
eukprot:362507-Chlamydomonas_euryale.AAC.15